MNSLVLKITPMICNKFANFDRILQFCEFLLYVYLYDISRCSGANEVFHRVSVQEFPLENMPKIPASTRVLLILYNFMWNDA